MIAAESAVERGGEEAQQSHRGGPGGAEAGERLTHRDREAAITNPGSARRDCGGGHRTHPLQVLHHNRGCAQPSDHLRQLLGQHFTVLFLSFLISSLSTDIVIIIGDFDIEMTYVLAIVCC